MKEVFEIHNPAYNFRTGATYFKRENVKKNHYGIQSVRYFGPKLWDTVPNNIKNCSSLNKFKISIKSWKPNECPYRLCKKYIAQAGFIWFTSSFCNISEEKKIIYILYFLRFFIYRFFNGKVSRGFPGYSFFFWQGRGQGGVEEGAPSLQIFLTICPRVCGDSAFPEDFLAGNCVKFLYFCSGCHYLLYLLVCLLSVYFLLLLLLLSLLS